MEQAVAKLDEFRLLKVSLIFICQMIHGKRP